MASFPRLPLSTWRCVVVYPAAIALLLPLDANCSSCAGDVGDCPVCLAIRSNSPTVTNHEACCRVDRRTNGSSAVTQSIDVHDPTSGTCSCRPLPIQHATPHGQ